MDDYSRLNKELEKFEKQFDTLGAHINHAQATFDGAARQLETLSNKLTRIGESSGVENPGKEE
jgi:hypothetical protein